ncbi:membrane protein, partial [Streptomyces sp. NRRL F-6602]
TVLTLLLWLLAVAKRAVRGVPLATALSEAIGFLWLTVLASAFTPLILYTVVSATDSVTTVLAKSTGGQTDAFFGTFSEALKKGEDIGGGPIMLIVVSLVSILAAGVLWLELVIRAALLYVG